MTPFLPSGMRIRPRMTVGVRCNAPKAWTIYVQATVSVQGQYLVAARPIAMGQAVSAQDLTTREGDLVALPPGAVTASQAVVGMLAGQRIAAGQIIKSGALRHPRAVSRGQRVRITARGNGFVVNSEGQALDNAPPGATVQVRTASGQVVSGIVENAGVVEVQL
jgi:flagella basal body P-ring formation protein FlgA